MARRKTGIIFAEAAGRAVESIEFDENADWQALIVTFSDGKVLSFELSARVHVRANYGEKRQGSLKLLRKYGRISADPRQKGHSGESA